MLAAQVKAFGRPEDAVEIVELDDPGEPGAEEVTVAAEFAPINPADVLNLEGKYGATPPPLLADGTLAVDVEAVYPMRKIKEAVAHAARGGRSGKILLSFAIG